VESTKEKICPKCGEKLTYDSVFCVKCGTKIEVDPAYGEGVNNSQNFGEKKKNKTGIVLAAVIGILMIFFIINFMQVSNLKKELLRDWSRVDGDNGAYIICILDFSDDEIKYRLETGYAWMDTTLATYDYKVISGNKIKVLRYGDWETFSVEFNEDKTMMTVKPALTSIDGIEHWFNLD